MQYNFLRSGGGGGVGGELKVGRLGKGKTNKISFLALITFSLTFHSNGLFHTY